MNKERILRNLNFLCDKHKDENATFKVRAYKKAIQVVTAHIDDIMITDLPKLNVGARILEKIKYIISTGKDLDQVINTSTLQNETNSQLEYVNILQSVHNIGNKKAQELVDKYNIKSIDELHNKLELLNAKQIAGLKYHNEIQQRIPREEMDMHYDFLSTKLKDENNILTFTITGSYRRNVTTSGDIDVLLCIKTQQKNTLKNLINKLDDYIPKQDGTFALGEKKFMGMCKHPNCISHRRLDIMLTTADYYPFALLYFSGNSDFNVEMREYAIKKGYLLNEYGLFKLPEQMRKKTKIKHTSSLERIDICFEDSVNNEYLESCIFKQLDLKYIEPCERKSGNIIPL